MALLLLLLGCGAARGDEAHADEAPPPPSGAGARCGAGTELEDGYCVVAERGRPSDGGAAAVLVPGASSLFVDPGSSVDLDWSPPLDLLALLEGDDGWMGGNYLGRARDVGLALAGFDYPGAFRVVNITVRSDAPFQVIVTDGQKKGRDVCFNQRGRDVHGDSPWAKLPFPRKVTYSLADSVAAMWEHAGSDSTSWLGRKVQQSLLQEASWLECSFTVSRFRPITFRVDGSAAEISAATVRDDLRILSQATSMALLLNAEMVSESMVVWCSSGVFGGSVLLTILIVIMVMKKVDNNRRGCSRRFGTRAPLLRATGRNHANAPGAAQVLAVCGRGVRCDRAVRLLLLLPSPSRRGLDSDVRTRAAAAGAVARLLVHR